MKRLLTYGQIIKRMRLGGATWGDILRAEIAKLGMDKRLRAVDKDRPVRAIMPRGHRRA